MNKTKMILAVTGGVLALAVFVLAYFTWAAFAAKTAVLEGDDEAGVTGLETVRSRVKTLSAKGIYPCPASVRAVVSNREALVSWKESARNLAARGDRIYEKMTAAAFKAFLVQDAKRLAALPAAAGRLAAPTFAFGPFQPYIAEGRMPAEADLAVLQRQWDDCVTLAELLSTNGVTELKGFELKAKIPPKVAENANGKNAKNAKNTKAKAKKAKAKVKSKKGEKEPEVRQPSEQTYALSFTARPAAFAKILNALETCERYIVTDDFSFAPSLDRLGEALGAAKTDAASAAAPTGRRRGRSVAVATAADASKQEEKGTVVSDPATEAPLAVTLTVTVYDFRTLEEEPK